MADAPHAGTTLVLMGDRLRFLATAAESGGAMTALEVAMRPGGGPETSTRRPRGRRARSWSRASWPWLPSTG
jgi:hypothetical protein